MVLLHILVSVLVLSGFHVSETQAEELRPVRGRVLFVNSYHPGLEWGDALYEGFLSALGDGVEVYPEYLDTKRFVEGTHDASFLNLLEEKYRDRTIDVVVASDDAAYRLLIGRPIALLESVPIVFCGVNEFSPDDYSDDRITGIAEVTDISATLDLVFELHPDLSHLIVVTDDTLNGRAHAAEIAQYARTRSDGDRIVIPGLFRKTSIDEYVRMISDAGPDAVVYYSDYFVDPDGFEVFPQDAFDRIAAAGDPPIYGHGGLYLRNGLLGGKLVLPEEQGATAGRYVERILGGEPVSLIPVDEEGPKNFVFDAHLLRRHGIHRDALPANHLLVNTVRDRLSEPGFLLRTGIPVVLVLAILLFAAIATVAMHIRSARQLAYERELFQVLMDQSPDLIFFKDRDGKFIKTNRAHDAQVGIPPDESSVGRSDDDFYPREMVREQRDLEDRIIATGKGSQDNLEHHVSPDGREHWMLCSKMPYRNVNGEIIGIVGLSRDVTDEIVAKEQLTAALKEREILLKEIHHRIKNNMQLIASILNLQKEQIRDASVQDALEEAQLRVYTMAMVHEHLYQTTSIARLDLGEYLSAVLLHVLGFVRSGLSIDHRLQTDSILVEPETAIHIGLIVSELLSNAVKHAFPDRTAGVIELNLVGNREGFTLTIKDDGIGCDSEYDPETATTMGMQIVTALVHQLNGRFRMEVNHGTTSEVVIPHLPPRSGILAE